MTEVAQDILEEMEQALADKEALREERGVGEQPKGMRLSQKTNIEFGDKEMPGRTRAWRTDDGREVWLNTGELPHHLNKRRSDGKRIFVLKKPSVAERVPTDLKCNVCLRMRGDSRLFYDRSQYEDHQEILHPREWQRELREQERTQRDRSTDALIALAERGAPNGRTTETTNSEAVAPSPPTEGVEANRVIGAGTNWVCIDCRRGFKSKAALGSHARTHASVSSVS